MSGKPAGPADGGRDKALAQLLREAESSLFFAQQMHGSGREEMVREAVGKLTRFLEESGGKPA